MGPRLVDRIDRTDRNLLVWMAGADEPLRLPWIWVRDHSRDPSAYDATTSQRTVDTFTIGADLRAEHIELVDDTIMVRWHGGVPESAIPAALLVEAAGAPISRPRLWERGADVDVAPIDYDALIDSDEGVAMWLQSITHYGMALAARVTRGRAAAEALAGRLGYVRRTVFGDLWTLATTITDHADSAYGEATLEPHTDGAYSHDAPGLQLFVCQERTGDGGESVLVDGFAAAESLRARRPDAFATLSQVDVPAQYIDDGVHLRARRPTIRLAPDGAVEQVTFNNYDRAPFLLTPEHLHEWYAAYSEFHEILVDRERWWSGRLEPGDALIVDNWRCLHGRMGFTGSRVFEGCYLNREDLESATRISGHF